MRFMLDGEVAAQGAGKVRMATLLSINNYYYHRGGAEAIFFAHNKMFEALGWRVAPSLTGAMRATAGRSDAQIEEMGKNGRSWVEEKFTADAYRERILQTYRELGVQGPGLLPATARV